MRNGQIKVLNMENSFSKCTDEEEEMYGSR